MKNIYQLLIESVYQKIYEQRMSDMPMCNPKINIDSVGFEEWRGMLFGIVVTPWFINLMLIPKEKGIWDKKPTLQEETVCFPSGFYRFVVGNDESIGTYLSCSLFSMMHEFQDHTAAIDTANSAYIEIMNDQNIEANEFSRDAIVEQWNKQTELMDRQTSASDKASTEGQTESMSAEEAEAQERLISRRQLFGGSRKAVDGHAE